MNFLFDEHIPSRLAKAIAALADGDGYGVHHLREIFPAATKDVDWIADIGARGGWFFLSEDRRIRTRPAERIALQQAGLSGFFFAKGWNQEGLWGRAALLVRWWPQIIETANTANAGDFFEVPFSHKPRNLVPSKH